MPEPTPHEVDLLASCSVQECLKHSATGDFADRAALLQLDLPNLDPCAGIMAAVSKRIVPCPQGRSDCFSTVTDIIAFRSSTYTLRPR